MTEWRIKEIIRIVEQCEKIQKSDMNRMAKEEEKVSAYDEIAKLVSGKEQNDNT